MKKVIIAAENDYALAFLPDNQATPFAVYRKLVDGDEDSFVSGHYCRTIYQAVANYANRLGYEGALGHVKIEVFGGVAEITERSPGVAVQLIDHDNECHEVEPDNS